LATYHGKGGGPKETKKSLDGALWKPEADKKEHLRKKLNLRQKKHEEPKRCWKKHGKMSEEGPKECSDQMGGHQSGDAGGKQGRGKND